MQSGSHGRIDLEGIEPRLAKAVSRASHEFGFAYPDPMDAFLQIRAARMDPRIGAMMPLETITPLLLVNDHPLLQAVYATLDAEVIEAYGRATTFQQRFHGKVAQLSANDMLWQFHQEFAGRVRIRMAPIMRAMPRLKEDASDVSTLQRLDPEALATRRRLLAEFGAHQHPESDIYATYASAYRRGRAGGAGLVTGAVTAVFEQFNVDGVWNKAIRLNRGQRGVHWANDPILRLAVQLFITDELDHGSNVIAQFRRHHRDIPNAWAGLSASITKRDIPKEIWRRAEDGFWSWRVAQRSPQAPPPILDYNRWGDQVATDNITVALLQAPAEVAGDAQEQLVRSQFDDVRPTLFGQLTEEAARQVPPEYWEEHKQWLRDMGFDALLRDEEHEVYTPAKSVKGGVIANITRSLGAVAAMYRQPQVSPTPVVDLLVAKFLADALTSPERPELRVSFPFLSRHVARSYDYVFRNDGTMTIAAGSDRITFGQAHAGERDLFPNERDHAQSFARTLEGHLPGLLRILWANIDRAGGSETSESDLRVEFAGTLHQLADYAEGFTLSGRRLTGETLLEAVWPDEPPYDSADLSRPPDRLHCVFNHAVGMVDDEVEPGRIDLSAYGVFTGGQAGAFAVAGHDLTGWTPVAFVRAEHTHDEICEGLEPIAGHCRGAFVHVGLSDPALPGSFFDIRGMSTVQQTREVINQDQENTIISWRERITVADDVVSLTPDELVELAETRSIFPPPRYRLGRSMFPQTLRDASRVEEATRAEASIAEFERTRDEPDGRNGENPGGLQPGGPRKGPSPRTDPSLEGAVREEDHSEDRVQSRTVPDGKSPADPEEPDRPVAEVVGEPVDVSRVTRRQSGSPTRSADARAPRTGRRAGRTSRPQDVPGRQQHATSRRHANSVRGSTTLETDNAHPQGDREQAAHSTRRSPGRLGSSAVSGSSGTHGAGSVGASSSGPANGPEGTGEPEILSGDGIGSRPPVPSAPVPDSPGNSVGGATRSLQRESGT